MLVMAVKYFGWRALLLALAQWPVVVANNLGNARWRNLQGDLAFIPEIFRRLRAAWQFRQANRSWNYYHPGEQFFHDPEFRG